MKEKEDHPPIVPAFIYLSLKNLFVSSNKMSLHCKSKQTSKSLHFKRVEIMKEGPKKKKSANSSTNVSQYPEPNLHQIKTSTIKFLVTHRSM